MTINSGFTGLAITVDGSEFDANPTDLTAGESLTITNDNTALTALGGAFNDTITSNAGNDSIVGNGGADSIKAGGGADTIEGGSGADSLWVKLV